MTPSFPVPPPPCAQRTGLPWDVTVDDAVAAIAQARARHGDTFVVESGHDHYFFTFSPAEVASFYALPEEKASKGVAALGWALVDLLGHPAELDRVAAGDTDLAQRCALESTRMGQRSIMSRAVLAPVDLDTGETTYRVPVGWTIATLLPLLNTSAAPGLELWNPDRWNRHRLAEASALPSPMLVTAFGHGKHSCPAQPFSLAAMSAAITHLLRRYEMTPEWTAHPSPVPAQIGGVARAAGPCPIRYCATQ